MPASRSRLAGTLAAILLVLHWAAPSFSPLQFPTSRTATPAYASATMVAHRGTLPRVLARVQALEAGLPKSNRNASAASAKFKALPQIGHRAEPNRAAVGVLVVRSTPRTALPAHSFQARAPPIEPA
jgi:hypothetical protein